MKAKMVSRSSWADLPTELLVMIAKCLESRIDICRFRSVCTSWRSSVLQLQSPLQYDLPLAMDDTEPKYCFYLVPKYIYCFEPITEKSSSPNSWIIAVEELEGNKLHPLNLFTGTSIMIHPLNFPKELNLSSFRITELQKVYRMESVCRTKMQKVVFLDQTGNETVIAVLKDDRTLSFFELETEEWVLIWKFNKYPVLDIAAYNGEVCVLFKGGRGAIVDSSFNLKEFASPIYPDGIHCTGYLVESSGDLFLVDQIVPREAHGIYVAECDEFQFLDLSLPLVLSSSLPSMAFKVYMLHAEEDEYRWIEVMSLGDRVMFTSCELSCWFSWSSWSFSLSSHQIPSLTNCIVFVDDMPNSLSQLPTNVLVFNMQTRKLAKIDKYPGEFNKLWLHLSSLWQV